jgi:hypothetical protein
MARSTSFFSRVFADFFPSSVAPARPAAPVPPQPQPAAPKVVGQGASNETHVTIAGVPSLFVDEGDCIVQFEPAFDEHTEQTAFGLKILPDLVPHWAQTRVHRCGIKDAIAQAIRGAGQPSTPPVDTREEVREPTGRVEMRADDEPAQVIQSAADKAARHDAAESPSSAITSGRILSWGEEKFPRRKGTGPRFYTSFAMHIDTASGERTLQGEGLKDAISEARCKVGDLVSVRRLRKIKVQAFDEKTGEPRTRDGKPVLWDKWLWSITN